MSLKIVVTFFVVTLSKTVPIDNGDYTQPEKSSWLKNLLIISGKWFEKIFGYSFNDVWPAISNTFQEYFWA